jgi:hypothetical protein
MNMSQKCLKHKVNVQNIKNDNCKTAMLGLSKHSSSEHNQISTHLFFQIPITLILSNNYIYCFVYFLKPYFLRIHITWLCFSFFPFNFTVHISLGLCSFSATLNKIRFWWLWLNYFQQRKSVWLTSTARLRYIMKFNLLIIAIKFKDLLTALWGDGKESEIQWRLIR